MSAGVCYKSFISFVLLQHHKLQPNKNSEREKKRKEEKRRGNDLPEAENKRGGERGKVDLLFDRCLISCCFYPQEMQRITAAANHK